jgi:hypothetical protein
MEFFIILFIVLMALGAATGGFGGYSNEQKPW